MVSCIVCRIDSSSWLRRTNPKIPPKSSMMKMQNRMVKYCKRTRPKNYFLLNNTIPVPRKKNGSGPSLPSLTCIWCLLSPQNIRKGIRPRSRILFRWVSKLSVEPRRQIITAHDRKNNCVKTTMSDLNWGPYRHCYTGWSQQGSPAKICPQSPMLPQQSRRVLPAKNQAINNSLPPLVFGTQSKISNE